MTEVLEMQAFRPVNLLSLMIGVPCKADYGHTTCLGGDRIAAALFTKLCASRYLRAKDAAELFRPQPTM